ncbi:MAG: alanine racemase [Planctomycetota bacterium]|jgi:3-hydroxy-D-aspartate aldolase|nr:alanine racemase [Planctomycetota bacterium]
MNVHQLETPALILDLDRYEENFRIMKNFTEANGIRLRPHYKSHKCTWIAHDQIAAGAKGITCATLGEAEDAARAGIEDILIANQAPQMSKVTRIAYLATCCRLTVCVDSTENIAALEAAAALESAAIHVLVEYDVGMRRCGVTDAEEFLLLAKLADAAPHLVFEGIQAYAGNLSHEADFEKRKKNSDWVESRLSALKKYVENAGLKIREVSGTSTGTVQFRPKNSVYTEIQPGSYIFMDKAYSLLNLPFRNALFLLTQVISVVGKERIVTCGGMKSISVDQANPSLAEYPGIPVEMSEEHCTLPFVPEGITVGDYLRLIPGHCCTTMNLHDHMYLVRKDKVMDRREIVSRGKSR